MQLNRLVSTLQIKTVSFIQPLDLNLFFFLFLDLQFHWLSHLGLRNKRHNLHNREN